VIRIAAFGLVSRGKSAVLNALAGAEDSANRALSVAPFRAVGSQRERQGAGRVN